MSEERATTRTAVGRGWWTRPFSNIQTNIQEIDATMDVDRVLDFIEEKGADTWLLNVGGIMSFYPTDLPFQTPVSFLKDRPSGDLIGDAVAAAHKRGIRVLARMDFSKVSTRIAGEHPEWLFKSPSGRPQIYSTLYSTCPCGDYYQKHSLEIIDEVMDRYDVGGFFVNWFRFSEFDYSRVYHGVCHCERCKAAFGAYAPSLELPDGPQHATYPNWLRFAAEVIQDLVDRLALHVAAKGKDAALIMSRESPIIYYEANNAFGRELWHHATSEAVSVYRTGMPSSSVLVNSTCFVDMPYRMAGEQPEHFAQYLLQAIARGGNPSTYLMGEPGRIPYPNVPMAGEIQNFFKANGRLYGNYRPGSTVALVRPNPLRKADPEYPAAVSEFRGLYCALKEKHIPFDVIGVELISRMAGDGNLSRYSAIILPDVNDIGAAAAASLDDYARRGGNVVLTGRGGVASDGSVELTTAPSVMQFAEQKTGMNLWATYVADYRQPDAENYRYTGDIIPVFGSYTSFVWKPNCTRLGSVLPQAPFGPPEKCYGHIGSDEPGAVSATTGGGTVLQIPWSVGRTYHEFGTTSVRDYFLRAISHLIRGPLSATLPEQVELIAGRVDDGMLIHLINQSGARRKSFGPHIPIAGGSIRVRGGTGQPRLLVSAMSPPTRLEGDELIIELPSLDLFEVVHVNTLS
ncbi:beta-galactosidase trimerization domain-containing protein [Rhizobium acidisoli]|nr:beta-galactosidase trimerization domain-containing protein [Rhizobium acidisoli]KPH04779.1 hypothetical protein AOG23_31210 [Rhizobium acidisoli]